MTDPPAANAPEGRTKSPDGAKEASLPLLSSCDGCGACCRHMIAPPFLMSGGRNEAREKGVPQSLIDQFWPRWTLRLQLPESACVWYDEAAAQCRHYELRPDACRAFDINSGPCQESRRKWGVA